MVTLKGVLNTVQTKYEDLCAQYQGSKAQKYVNLTAQKISDNKETLAKAAVATAGVFAAYKLGAFDLKKQVIATTDNSNWGYMNTATSWISDKGMMSFAWIKTEVKIDEPTNLGHVVNAGKSAVDAVLAHMPKFS